MIHRLMTLCFLSSLLMACNAQDHSDSAGSSLHDDIGQNITPGQQTDGNTGADIISTAEPEKPEYEAKQALNLSITSALEDGSEPDHDTGLVDLTKGDDQASFIISDKKKQADVNMSGKVFTDQTRIDNKDYLNSVDGIQLNIEKKFN